MGGTAEGIIDVEEPRNYGLYDLARLEQIILAHVAGDFFTLEEDEMP